MKVSEHNHAPNAVDIALKKVMKKRCKKSTDFSANIVLNCTKIISNVAALTLPSISALRRTVQKARKGRNENVLNVMLPVIFTKAANGVPFLLNGSSGKNRFLLYTTAGTVVFS